MKYTKSSSSLPRSGFPVARKKLNIPNVRPASIGFVSGSGFEFTSEDYELITGEMLYF